MYNICLVIHDTVSGCADSICFGYWIQKMGAMGGIHEVIFINNIPTTYSTVDLHSNDLYLNPNPASNAFKAKAGGESINEIIIRDITGKILRHIPNYKGEDISLEAFPSGMYLINGLIIDTWNSAFLIKQ
jgi:hypothetical protein